MGGGGMAPGDAPYPVLGRTLPAKVPDVGEGGDRFVCRSRAIPGARLLVPVAQ